jgi:hypothetical protein
MKTNVEGRIYTLTKSEKDTPQLMADLVKRGFDGFTYLGESLPVGRQRRQYAALFYRRLSGEFVPIIRI